jgi:hypothetical protein
LPYSITSSARASSDGGTARLRELAATQGQQRMGVSVVRANRGHSQVLSLKLRLLAFLEAARLIWSEAPSGKSALTSKRIFTLVWGSLARTPITSSAIYTRRILAVEVGYSRSAGERVAFDGLLLRLRQHQFMAFQKPNAAKVQMPMASTTSTRLSIPLRQPRHRPSVNGKSAIARPIQL